MRVLILSLFLFYLEGQAEIIPKKQLPPLKEDEEYKTIFIKEGDTLWDIANRYYNNPQKWREFEFYNTFTDPNLIYPGEQLTLKLRVIPKPKEIKGAIPATLSPISLGTPATAEKIGELKKEIEKKERELKEAKEKEETLRAAYTNLNLGYGTLSLYSKKLEEELNLIKRQIKEREEAERKNQEKIKSLEKKNKMLKATIGLTALAALSLLLIFR
jgi:hypothetical protein